MITTKPINPPIEMSGQHVGAWHVLDYAGPRHSRAAWWCRHECGAEKKISGLALRRGAPGAPVLGCRECGK